MERDEINQNIYELESEIYSVELDLEKYQTMSRKINEALPKLRNAKNNMDDAFFKLKKHYSNDGKPEDDGRFQSIIDNINGKIKLLEQILAECNREVNSIKSDINAKKNEISNLEDRLYYMD